MNEQGPMHKIDLHDQETKGINSSVRNVISGGGWIEVKNKSKNVTFMLE